ncbi:hypothetical protein MMC14_001638 [Varicellaria rhodocarpa]|nr:hypothetical protein [Varicellaria rhodocarpa]
MAVTMLPLSNNHVILELSLRAVCVAFHTVQKYKDPQVDVNQGLMTQCDWEVWNTKFEYDCTQAAATLIPQQWLCHQHLAKNLKEELRDMGALSSLKGLYPKGRRNRNRQPHWPLVIRFPVQKYPGIDLYRTVSAPTGQQNQRTAPPSYAQMPPYQMPPFQGIPQMPPQMPQIYQGMPPYPEMMPPYLEMMPPYLEMMPPYPEMMLPYPEPMPPYQMPLYQSMSQIYQGMPLNQMSPFPDMPRPSSPIPIIDPATRLVKEIPSSLSGNSRGAPRGVIPDTPTGLFAVPVKPASPVAIIDPATRLEKRIPSYPVDNRGAPPVFIPDAPSSLFAVPEKPASPIAIIDPETRLEKHLPSFPVDDYRGAPRGFIPDTPSTPVTSSTKPVSPIPIIDPETGLIREMPPSPPVNNRGTPPMFIRPMVPTSPIPIIDPATRLVIEIPPSPPPLNSNCRSSTPVFIPEDVATTIPRRRSIIPACMIPSQVIIPRAANTNSPTSPLPPTMPPPPLMSAAPPLSAAATRWLKKVNLIGTPLGPEPAGFIPYYPRSKARMGKTATTTTRTTTRTSISRAPPESLPLPLPAAIVVDSSTQQRVGGRTRTGGVFLFENLPSPVSSSSSSSSSLSAETKTEIGSETGTSPETTTWSASPPPPPQPPQDDDVLKECLRREWKCRGCGGNGKDWGMVDWRCESFFYSARCEEV